MEAQLAAARVREAELLKLLGQWASLAEVQQRVLHSMRNEVTMTSGFVETHADAIGTRFRELAGAARNQTDRVGSLVALAGVIEVDGEEVPLSGVTGLLTETLNDIVAKIIFLSRNAMSMVFAMDNVTKDLAAIERCINDVDKINKQTNMLALNAMIEATRAGEAGVAFRVVANEVQEVSKAVRGLAQTMRTEVGTIAQGIRDGHTILQELATVDMSPNIMAKDKLDQLVAALLQRDQTTESVVKDISRKAEEISTDISGLITEMQFQDRARQRLEHVVDTLAVVADSLKELEGTTGSKLPEAPKETPEQIAWLKQLAARYTLGELRARFVARVLEGRSMEAVEPSSPVDDDGAEGTVELF
ncbi:MAG: methyl-accepting chemotaxis protein [Stellaceae bacterium]